MSAKTKQKPKTALGKIVNYVTTAVLILVAALLAVSAFTAVTQKNNPEKATVFGFKPFTIKSGSMEPKIRTKALILAKQAVFSELKEGDIIVFEKESTTITHRVTALVTDERTGKQAVQTKGDAVAQQDPFLVYPEDVRFKVVLSMNFVAAFRNGVMPDDSFSLAGALLWIGLPAAALVALYVALKKLEKLYAAKMAGIPAEETQNDRQEVLAVDAKKTKKAKLKGPFAMGSKLMFGVAALALVFVVAVSVVMAGQSYPFGTRPVVVGDDRMAGEIIQDAVVTVEKVTALHELKYGDKVCFLTKNADGKDVRVVRTVAGFGGEGVKLGFVNLGKNLQDIGGTESYTISIAALQNGGGRVVKTYNGLATMVRQFKANVFVAALRWIVIPLLSLLLFAFVLRILQRLFTKETPALAAQPETAQPPAVDEVAALRQELAALKAQTAEA